jgi:hypothetical protein
VVVSPLIVGARKLGRHDLHVNLGVDLNASDLDRTRLRYAVGGSVYAWKGLSALVDVIGTSGVSADHFTERLGGQRVSGTVARTDIVDLYTGLKVDLPGRFLGHVGVLLPLTDDGLRADAIPVGGVECSF